VKTSRPAALIPFSWGRSWRVATAVSLKSSAYCQGLVQLRSPLPRLSLFPTLVPIRISLSNASTSMRTRECPAMCLSARCGRACARFIFLWTVPLYLLLLHRDFPTLNLPVLLPRALIEMVRAACEEGSMKDGTQIATEKVTKIWCPPLRAQLSYVLPVVKSSLLEDLKGRLKRLQSQKHGLDMIRLAICHCNVL